MRKLFIYLFLLFPAMLNAQKWTFQYEFGYGSFQLKDIKAIQDRVVNSMSMYGARTTEYFPNHYIQSASIGYILGQHHFGVSAFYLTTGGRVHVGDYSGEYKADMLLNGYRLGIFYRYYIPNKIQWFNIYGQVAPGILFSRLTMDEDLVIGSQKLEDDLKFKSTGAYIEPSIGVRFKPLHWLNLSVGGGYEIDAWGKMKLSKSNSQITYSGEDNIRWNGFRLYAGLFITIPNLSTTK